MAQSPNRSAAGPMLIDLDTQPTEKPVVTVPEARPMEIDLAAVVAVVPADPPPESPSEDGAAVPAAADGAVPSPVGAGGANWPLRLFAGGVVFIVIAGLGFDAADLLTRAFALHPVAGWLTAGVLGAALAGLAGMIAGEWRGLARLRRLDDLRGRAEQLVDRHHDGHDHSGKAGVLAAALVRHYDNRVDMAAALADLRLRLPDCHDDGQVVRLLDQSLLTGLDKRAYALTGQAARDAAVMTTLLPSAVLDMTVALWRNLRLVRAIATLYGTRPGYWASLRLLRRLLASLAATGATEGLHHVAVDMLGGTAVAAVSTALGKGLVNGLLTARIGLAAMQVCRPVPFSPATKPGLSGIRATLLGLSSRGADARSGSNG